jgi:hypothetical protein
MNSLINLLLIFLSLTSFNNPAKTQNELIQTQERPRELSRFINGKRLYINDTSLYSQRFIRELQQSLQGATDSLILINDTLFTYSTYKYKDKTIHSRFPYSIPDGLQSGKQVIYKLDQNGKNFSLALLRTNLTEIKFDLSIDGHKTKSGVAILGGTFYYGAECGPIDENDKMYCFAQYLSDNCFVKSAKDSKVSLKIQLVSGEHVYYNEYFSNEEKQDIRVILRRQ